MLGRYDYITLTIVILLVASGLIAIYSATSGPDYEAYGFFIRQLLWAIFGVMAMIGVSFIPQRIISRFVYPLYIFTVFLLVLVFIVGRVGQGAERWLVIGPVHIQPSELAKLATILAVSKFLSDKYADVNRLKYFSLAIGLILLPFVLIARQPDLGTALVFLALIIPLLYWAGLNWFYIFTIVIPLLTMIVSFNFWAFLGLMIFISLILAVSQKKPIVIAAVFLLNISVGIATPYLWNQLRPYQQQRIKTFINPEKDPKGSGYQIIQSQVAIGSGGIWGKGYLHGTQTHLRFLPAQHTDFIFSVIGEEFGFVGVSSILILFLLLTLRLVHIASTIREQFSSMILVGIATVFVFHTLINIGMTIGMAPVTGLPLPFLSYGGSSLLTNLVMVGIALNIYRHKYTR
jgi:rod shape determining protein RodA